MDTRLLQRATIRISFMPILSWVLLLAGAVFGLVFYENIRSTNEHQFSLQDTLSSIIKPDSSIFINFWAMMALLVASVFAFCISYSREFSKAKLDLARHINIHERISRALYGVAGKHIISKSPVDVNVKSSKDVMSALQLIKKDLTISWWDGGDHIREVAQKDYFAKLKANKKTDEEMPAFDAFAISNFSKTQGKSTRDVNHENILSISVRIGRRYEATMFDLMAIIETLEKYENEVELHKSEKYNSDNKSDINKGKLTAAVPRQISFISETDGIAGSSLFIERALDKNIARVFTEKTNILGALNGSAFLMTDETVKIGAYVPSIVFSDEFATGEKKKFTKVIISADTMEFGTEEIPVSIPHLQLFFDHQYPLPGDLGWEITQDQSSIYIDLAKKKISSAEEVKAESFASKVIKASIKVSGIPFETNLTMGEVDHNGNLASFSVLLDIPKSPLNTEDNSRLSKFFQSILKILSTKIPGDWDYQYTAANGELVVKNFAI